MERKEMLLLLDELLELETGTLKGNETLEELQWNSLAIIGFIAIIDEQLGVIIPPKDIAKAKSINNLITLVENKIPMTENIG